jgi:predicted  nucleic acid-binding Zn-ribbon protein
MTTTAPGPFAPTDHARIDDLSVSARDAGRNGTELLLGIVERSEGVFRQLETLAIRAAEVSHEANHASTELQERLRLGVKMLQAFDVQFERAKAMGPGPAAPPPFPAEALAELERRMIERQEASLAACTERMVADTGRLDRLEAGLASLAERASQAPPETNLSMAEDELRARAERIVDETLERCIARLAHRFDDETSRREWRLGEIEGRARDLMNGLEHSVGRAEDLLRRLGETGHWAEERNETLRGTCETAGAIQGHLASELETSGKRLEETREGVRESLRELVELVDRTRSTREELYRQVEDLDRVAATARSTGECLSSLAGRLAPWTPLLDGERNLNGVAETLIETVSGGIRASLEADIRTFSQGLRSLASTAENAFSSVRIDDLARARREPAGTGNFEAGAT